jgi:HEAT repeat protein
MRRALPTLVFVGLFALVAALLFALKEGDPPPRDDDRPESGAEPGLPSVIPPARRDQAAGARARIRDSLGRDATAVAELGFSLPEAPEDRVEWLRFFRPELDLAIRSGDGAAGTAALQLLARALGEGDSPARTLIEGPGFRDTWIRALESGTDVLRASATRFLGRLGGTTCRARLPALLSDPAPGVRVAAVDVYAQHGTSARRLAALFEKETEPRVRLAILVALREGRGFRGPEARTVEAHAIANGSEAERIQAMKTLGIYRDQDRLAEVVANLSSESPRVRRAALETIHRLKDARALAPVKEMADREIDAEIRELASRVAEDLGR